MNTIIDNSTAVTGLRRIALSASIVLNLFLLAVIGGHVWHNHRPAPDADRPLARALADVEAALPAPDAAVFKATILADQQRFARTARTAALARLDLAKQITAEPFDPQATQRALVAWQASWVAFMTDLDEPLVHALGGISAEGRQKLVRERRDRLGPVTP